jgi:hypothetical protein
MNTEFLFESGTFCWIAPSVDGGNDRLTVGRRFSAEPGRTGDGRTGGAPARGAGTERTTRTRGRAGTAWPRSGGILPLLRGRGLPTVLKKGKSKERRVGMLVNLTKSDSLD